jgi:hypothetical protein
MTSSSLLRDFHQKEILILLIPSCTRLHSTLAFLIFVLAKIFVPELLRQIILRHIDTSYGLAQSGEHKATLLARLLDITADPIFIDFLYRQQNLLLTTHPFVE